MLHDSEVSMSQILIVDDEPMNAFVIHSLLAQNKMPADTVSSG